MAQIALVNEEVEAGRQLVEAFASIHPVKTAFWFKGIDESKWYLHIASEWIDKEGSRKGYEEIGRLMLAMPDPLLDPFCVKLLRTDDPLVAAVLAIHERYGRRVKSGMWYNASSLGGREIEGAYLYPLPVAV